MRPATLVAPTAPRRCETLAGTAVPVAPSRVHSFRADPLQQESCATPVQSAFVGLTGVQSETPVPRGRPDRLKILSASVKPPCLYWTSAARFELTRRVCWCEADAVAATDEAGSTTAIPETLSRAAAARETWRNIDFVLLGFVRAVIVVLPGCATKGRWRGKGSCDSISGAVDCDRCSCDGLPFRRRFLRREPRRSGPDRPTRGAGSTSRPR